MLAQRISSINTISALCENIERADIDEVSKAVGMDKRIGSRYLKAGIGFGGSCFRKDIKSLMYLAGNLGLQEVVSYWESVLSVNEWQRRRWVERVVRGMGGGLRGKRVVVLGYAFKRGTGDVRESLAGEVVRRLMEEKPECVVIWDDGCEGEVLREEVTNFELVRVEEDLYVACEGADAVLICRELEPSSEGVRPEFEDPRPFLNNLSEIDLLNLRNYLTSTSDTEDPLGRLYPEPSCEESCTKCAQSKKLNIKEARTIDWKRIITGMNPPRWIFDGRGVIDKSALQKIGQEMSLEVRVVGVGRQGW